MVFFLFLIFASSCDLTDYGKGDIHTVMSIHKKLDEVHVSLLDKNGWCRSDGSDWERFIHPGWVTNRHDVEDVKDVIEILKTYPDHSIDVIYYGSHGKNGHAYIGGKDIIDDEEAKELITSKLTTGGWFVFTGCCLGEHQDRMNDFSDVIRHPVVAATSNTDNDKNVSLWFPGKWRIFFGKTNMIEFIDFFLRTKQVSGTLFQWL